LGITLIVVTSGRRKHLKKYTEDMLRNVALVSHSGAGKTTLAESMLFLSGAINRRGTVEEGNTVSDYDPEEIKRVISINASIIPVEWQDHKINVIDTPGYFDFVGDAIAALSVVEAAVLTVCAASGIEVGTEKSWRQCEDKSLPRVIFINKMDRENANFNQVIDQLKERFGGGVIPLYLPIGSADKFSGLIDIIKMQAYKADDHGKLGPCDMPADMADMAEEARMTLIEAVAATDDDLTMKFLEDEPLTDDEIRTGLCAGVRDCSIFPVVCGSAANLIGVGELLSTITAYVSNPAVGEEVKATDAKGNEVTVKKTESAAPVAQVFKTMADPYVGKMSIFRVWSGVLKSDAVIYNATQAREERMGQLFVLRGKEHIPVAEVGAGDIAAVAKLQTTTTGDTLCAKDAAVKLPAMVFPAPKIALAIVPQAKGDEEKIGSGLMRLAEEDPTFTADKSPATGEMQVAGLGDLHLEVMISRLLKKFGVTAVTKDPRIPYKETIKSKVTAEYRHKKQSGGRGQYGHVIIEMEPLPPGGGFEFVDKIFGGAVPRQYIPAVEKGVRETMAEGVLSGHEVVDVRVTLLDGSYHDVDSSEMAFKLAASMAFKKGFMEAKPVLLEPINNIVVEVPDQYMGDIIGDLNKKRGRIIGMDPLGGGMQRIRAQAPHSELFRYAIDLRSMTQGRGDFTMEFDHYEEVPGNIAEQVIKDLKAQQEE
jgi:elongation factor G